MSKFLEQREHDFFLHSIKFCDKIDSYSFELGIDVAEVTLYKKEHELFNYVFLHKTSDGALVESFMNHKISYMQLHFYNLVLQCKSSSNYNNQIGEELGIAHITPSPHPTYSTPDITLDFTSDGCPVLKWNKGIFEGVEIWKDSGNGKGYQKLARSYKSEYADKSLLHNEKCEVWKYSVIYLFKDELVGNWSDEREIVMNNYVQ